MAYAFDPELAPATGDLPATDLTDLASARAFQEEPSGEAVPEQYRAAVTVDVDTLPGHGSHPAVRICRYAPVGAKEGGRPAVLMIHGGGFVVGAHQGYARECARLAVELDAVIVAVYYRLAPEHPFPAGLLDCYAALEWTAAQAAALGVDENRIAVLGDSAGAALAAGTSLLARDRQGPRICFQFLGIPVLDDRLATPSMRRFVDTPLWDSRAAALSWRYYLAGGTELDGVDAHRYAAPGRAEDLRHLPPTAVVTCEFDPLRDEGLDFGMRLLQAGVSTELHNYAGTFHGSTLLWRAAVSQRMWRDRVECLRRALTPTSEVPPA